ncbi:YaaA family protein [Mycoplasma anatis]|nr:YaaA family protein [Mycoplasmopsis anatis]
MLRWIAQNNLTDFEQIKSYRLDGFIFLKHENNEIVFIKEK